MTSMTVGELKTNFSEVLKRVQTGEEYQILYGRAKRPVARIIPIQRELPKRKLGVLAGKYKLPPGGVVIEKFESVEEFLGLQ